MFQPIRGQGGHLVFSDRPEKHRLGKGRCDLPSCPILLNSVQQFQRRSRKIFQPIIGQSGHLVFSDRPER